MDDVVYGDRWNTRMRFMIGAVPEAEARRRFVHGPWFSVASGLGLLAAAEEARRRRRAGEARPVPEFSLELEPGLTAVNTFFYDEFGSVLGIYAWRPEQGRLFLHSVTSYEYADEPRWHGQDESVLVEEVEFHLDGTSRQIVDDSSQPMLDVTDRRDVDLRKNWEPVPEFGDWAGLGRMDRRIG